MIPIVYHRAYSYPFPASHRFAMDKFARLEEYLRGIGLIGQDNLLVPGKARRELLSLAHHPDYVDRVLAGRMRKEELRRLGLPWSEGLLRRSLIEPHGTFLAGEIALREGIACHLAGGTHHADTEGPSGFCLFNDLAVAASALLLSRPVKRILIFDTDVHQGDGTARILADEPRVFTCSLHAARNFPVRKARSDLDIALPDQLGDEAYLHQIRQVLPALLSDWQPDLVLYDAGVDVHQADQLGYLALSDEGIRQRDQFVLEACRNGRIPVATMIGGGYDSDRAALARRHAIVVEVASQVFAPARNGA